jgi:group II intron reverse transcriptase/maturase
MAFTSLAHHVDQAFLREAYACTRKDGATGVDGKTAQEYAQDLEANLASLHERLKSGSYRAPPVRGVEIDKGGGKKRLLGIPTFEDKVLQRAVAMVLSSIYEQDFLPCSYGSRPGRSAHDALAALWREAMGMGGCWVLEADIRRYFDTLDHGALRAILDQRVNDGVIRRVIDKWLKAGVLKDGSIHSRTEGTPQGGVISPLLANIYLHEVLDVWFEQEVKPRLAGRAVLIRYVDDFVILFASEMDARRVMEVLPKRFGRFGLTLHPEKTKLIEFKPPAHDAGPQPGRASASRTFDLLGFTHFWGRTRKGRWAVKRKTMSPRLTRAISAIWKWCRIHRHLKVALQREALSRKLDGHYQYYGITGNSRSLAAFAHWVRRIWRYWLNRRGKRRSMPWPRFRRLLERHPLPAPCVVHSIYRRAANPRP